MVLRDKKKEEKKKRDEQAKADAKAKADAPVFAEVKTTVAFDGQTASADGRYRAINGRLVGEWLQL